MVVGCTAFMRISYALLFQDGSGGKFFEGGLVPFLGSLHVSVTVTPGLSSTHMSNLVRFQSVLTSQAGTDVPWEDCWCLLSSGFPGLLPREAYGDSGRLGGMANTCPP